MEADDYLIIPDDYGWALGGLRWSPAYDAIEFGEGGTLTVVEQLEQVLEGVFAAGASVPHFAHVLHLLELLLRGGRDGRAGESLWRLHTAYRQAHGPGVSRNAGVLIAVLCRSLPHVAAAPNFRQIRLDLKRRLLFQDQPDPRRAEKPPLGPGEFERRLADVLRGYDTPTLVHWLRQGCAPAAATGQRLAKSLTEPPRRAESLTVVLRRRPRLAGAVTLVTTFEAALALPPRRLRPDARPLGGYAGVTTRGDPERLLLSQFALEPLDFVRRFAENELLYFRREEPRRGERPTRLVVLDQGVRAWGGVRLALAGAVLALLGQDRRRHGPPRLALTSTDRPVFDPAELSAEELAGLLEASDLSPHPAACLTAALAEPADDGPRDVVLLTHPRNLREPAVVEAAGFRRPTDRLFALSVDQDGRAELGEWRGRGVVRVRAFRVDLAGAEAVRVAEPEAARPTAGATPPWTGDVEPIGYPFRRGLLGAPQGLVFEASGEWLAIVSPGGLLQVAKIGDTVAEVLPRAFHNGVALTAIEYALGVTHGFVVGGPMKVELPPGSFRFDSMTPPGRGASRAIMLAHYDLNHRRVTLHVIGPAPETDPTDLDDPLFQLLVFPALHSAAVRTDDWGGGIDLATGSCYVPGMTETEAVQRARQAWERADDEALRTPYIACLAASVDTAGITGPWVKMAGGVVWLGGIQPPWSPFIPTADGGRLFADHDRLGAASLKGQTLALRVGTDRGVKFILFRGPNGRVLGEYKLDKPDRLLELSGDGRLLARQTGRRAVEVIETTGGRPPVLSLAGAVIHPDLKVRLDATALTIAIGKFVHVFELGTVPLRYRCDDRLAHLMVSGTVVTAGPPEPVAEAVARDPQRFRAAAACGGWVALLDRWGQVVLLDPGGRPAAYFLVWRRLVAVCLPDGTRWGAHALLGGPETPGAADAVGRLLQSVGRG